MAGNPGRQNTIKHIHTALNAFQYIIDGTNIERNLYLTTQVCEMGVPVVMAINMMDVVRKNGDEIHPDEIAEHFGCTVFEISALKGTGVKRAVKRVIELARSNTGIPPVHHSFDDRVESVIHHISSLLPETIDPRKRRFYATKIFERDEEVLKDVPMPPGAAKPSSGVASEMTVGQRKLATTAIAAAPKVEIM